VTYRRLHLWWDDGGNPWTLPEILPTSLHIRYAPLVESNPTPHARYSDRTPAGSARKCALRLSCLNTGLVAERCQRTHVAGCTRKSIGWARLPSTWLLEPARPTDSEGRVPWPDVRQRYHVIEWKGLRNVGSAVLSFIPMTRPLNCPQNRN